MSAAAVVRLGLEVVEPTPLSWLDDGPRCEAVRTPYPGPDSLVIRGARPIDARGIHGLLEPYAERGLLLHRTLDEIYRTIKDFVVAVEYDGHVLGCGALRIYSDSLAEIAALAVAEGRHGQGVGGRIVRTLEAEARTRGIGRVFARTLQHGFFHKLGFSAADVHAFPETIDWGARDG